MKTLSIISIFILFASVADAQIHRSSTSNRKKQEDKFWQPEKIIVGGNVGPLYFGGQQNMLGFNLLSGYKVTENFWPGISFNYMNYNERLTYTDINGKQNFTKYTISAPGISLFARYRLFNFIMPSIELERNWLIEKNPVYDFSTNSVTKIKKVYGNTSLLVGGGFYRGNENMGSYVMLLYDVLYRDPSQVSVYQGNMALKVGFMMSGIFKSKK